MLVRLFLLSPFFLVSSCIGYSKFAERSRPIYHSFLTSSVFLSPIKPENKTIHIWIKNTTNLDILPALTKAVQKGGYTVVEDPEKARIHMQVSIKSYGVISESVFYSIQSSSNTFDESRYEKDVEHGKGKPIGALVGITKDKIHADKDLSGIGIGGIIGFAVSNSIPGVVGGAIVGGALSVGLESATKPFYIALVSDIQISEPSKITIWETDKRYFKQDDSSYRKTEYSDQTNRKTYRTQGTVVVTGIKISEKSVKSNVEERFVNLLSGLL